MAFLIIGRGELSRQLNSLEQRLKEAIVADLNQLNQAMQDALAKLQTAQEQETKTQQSVLAEIQRVETIITNLKGAGIDPALLDPVLAQMQTVSQNLSALTTTSQSTQAAADAEEPAAAGA